MINYRSLSDSLYKRGFTLTNTCTFDGKTYHDFTNKKTRETASATVEPISGAVEKVEVTRPCWDANAGRYVTVKDTYTGLEGLLKRIS